MAWPSPVGRDARPGYGRAARTACRRFVGCSCPLAPLARARRRRMRVHFSLPLVRPQRRVAKLQHFEANSHQKPRCRQSEEPGRFNARARLWCLGHRGSANEHDRHNGVQVVSQLGAYTVSPASRCRRLLRHVRPRAPRPPTRDSAVMHSRPAVVAWLIRHFWWMVVTARRGSALGQAERAVVDELTWAIAQGHDMLRHRSNNRSSHSACEARPHGTDGRPSWSNTIWDRRAAAEHEAWHRRALG
jgi:hypothetical protein